MSDPEALETVASKTIVVMPALNESEAIASVVREVRELSGLPVLVVDDGSTDGTVARAMEAGAMVIPLAAKLGAWGATQTGIRYALRKGYDTVVTMDADGQHKAESLGELIAPLQNGQADVTIGSCPGRGSILRRCAWVILKTVSGLNLEDITSGLRAYNKRALKELVGWRATMLDYQDIGVLLLLKSRGIRVVDKQVNMRPRVHGSSRVFNSWLMVMFYMCHTLLLSLTKRNSSPGIKSPGIKR